MSELLVLEAKRFFLLKHVGRGCFVSQLLMKITEAFSESDNGLIIGFTFKHVCKARQAKNITNTLNWHNN